MQPSAELQQCGVGTHASAGPRVGKQAAFALELSHVSQENRAARLVILRPQ